MVVSCLYGYIDKQTDGIDRHGDRHKDREIWREAIHPICLFVWSLLAVGLVRFGSLWFGSVRFTLI